MCIETKRTPSGNLQLLLPNIHAGLAAPPPPTQRFTHLHSLGWRHGPHLPQQRLQVLVLVRAWCCRSAP